MTPVSVCVIMKNEEKHLETFLSSIKQAFGAHPHEIVLVDTGSTDNSLSIAAKYASRIFHFEWIGDFSAARNFSLSKASYPWVLVLDCDEYVLSLDFDGLQEMIHRYPQAVGMLTCRNHYQMNGTDSIYTDKLERFFDKRYFHYEDIIHEQVRAINGKPCQKISVPVTVDHYGYSGSPEYLAQKALRNKELLLVMLKENPNDPYLYFQLGQTFHALGDVENTCYYYGKGLEFDVDPRTEYVQMMVIGYGYALLDLERFEEALQFQNIYDEFASSSDFVCLMGLIYMRCGMIAEAIDEFLKATTFQTAKTEGTNSFIPLFNLGCINEVLGNMEDALALYKKCGDFKPALERIYLLKAD